MQEPKVINFRDLGSQPDLVVENILKNLDRKSILAYCDTTEKMKEQCVWLPKKMWKWLIIRDCMYISHEYKWTFDEYKMLKCTSSKNDWLLNAAEYGDLELVKTLVKNEDSKNILLPLRYTKRKKIITFLIKELENRVSEGDEDAMITLGQYYEGEKKKLKASNMYKKAIKKGNSEAMIKLGLLYSNARNMEKLLKYLKMASKKGDPEAMFLLGNYYYEEEGDLDMTIKYYEMAIENGSDDCYIMSDLSDFYKTHRKDKKNAKKYKEMAKKCKKEQLN